jgi:hypothetical protein
MSEQTEHPKRQRQQNQQVASCAAVVVEPSDQKAAHERSRHPERTSLVRNVYLLGAVTIGAFQPHAWMAALLFFAGACVLHIGGRKVAAGPPTEMPSDRLDDVPRQVVDG